MDDETPVLDIEAIAGDQARFGKIRILGRVAALN
jgi:hypothetical protein